MKSILEIKDLNVTYKNKKRSVYAVKNSNFEIFKGDSLGLVGESGSGKSTLATALLRLHPKHSTNITGQANFLDRDLISISEKELQNIRWTELAVVFQKSMNSFSPVHRIGEQIEDIYRVHKPKATKKDIKERTSYLLSLVNLSDRVYRLYPHELSGGMIQRVSIAVSLLHNPKLLILDEATTALDVVTQGQILDEILKMEKEMDMTRIMITHDMSVVASSCNKVAIMYAGEIVEFGFVKDIIPNPKHPYTKGLLSSFPSLKGEKKLLKGIPGFLPDLSQIHEGCIFASRCDSVMDICKKVSPNRTVFKNTHTVSCHLYGGDNNGQ